VSALILTEAVEMEGEFCRRIGILKIQTAMMTLDLLACKQWQDSFETRTITIV
jgi:hypothetical protein